MLVRIENEVGKKKLLSQSQAAFRKNNRTTYQIMTLFTLIKKSLEEGKYLYTCFVYFRKVYDSIYRQRLIYILKEFGLTGNILENTKTMYATQKCLFCMTEKLVNLLAQKWDLNKAMCSVLFSSTNDLPDFLNKESNTEEDKLHIAKLDNFTTNDLSFSYDLTILSWSKYDLQKKISNLGNYCEIWGLELNLDKTRAMVFRKQGCTVKRKVLFSRKRNRNSRTVHIFRIHVHSFK